MGQDNLIEKSDFWEYDPVTDTWIQKADFADTAPYGAVGFSIGDKGYAGTGYSESAGFVSFNYFWQYDPAVDTWTQKADFGGTPRFDAVGFSIGNKGYIGSGSDTKDFWEYTPQISSCSVPQNLSVAGIAFSSARLTWDSGGDAASYVVSYRVAGTSP